jgi:nitroreductase
MPASDLETILNAAVQAPSSWNLQHWKFLVIESQAQKEKLLPIANNQQQVVDCSVVIAVLGDLQANLNAEEIYGNLVAKGKMPETVKETMLSQINGAYSNPEAKQWIRDEAIRNASYAAMQLMLAAKALGYDTCPMGGYNVKQFIEQFRVPERYVPTLLIAVGKAAKPAYPTERFPLDRVVVKETF